MKLFFVDFENVGSKGFEGIESLHAKDQVIVFYTKKQAKLTFEAHLQLLDCDASLEYRKVSHSGKNALDFQLSSYLGYMIANYPEAELYIVSSDRDFEVIIEFWKSFSNKDISQRVNCSIGGDLL